MTPTRVREILDRHGLAPSRDRGQNFLIDASVAERLVEGAGLADGDAAIEVGTGLGILSRTLAERGVRLTTLEIDAGLVRALRAEALLPESVELRHVDALEVDWPALVAERGACSVIGNLPYAISAPLLRKLLDLHESLRDWSVMIQRDVAERLLAGPGSRRYGSLSVLHQLCVRIERVRELSPKLFFPVPKVRSTFLRMTPRRDDAPGVVELRRIEGLLRAAFGQRRKTLANALASNDGRGPGVAAPADVCRAAGVDPGARAEQLAPEHYRELARAFAAAEAA